MNMKSSTKTEDNFLIFPGGAFLPGVGAAITFENKEFLSPPDNEPKPITVKKKDLKYIPWGANDNLPNLVQQAIGKNPTASRGLEFNIVMCFGKGIRPVTKDKEGKTSDLASDHPVSLFFENNDLSTWYLEQCTDMNFFFNPFNEIVLSDDGSQILKLNHIEAMFSRLSERNDKGIIENHLYCAKFGTDKTPTEDDVEVSPVLPSKFTVDTLRYKVGKAEGSKDTNQRRFVLHNPFPTPGRIYYPKPYWYSILESGWLEFANAVPKYKQHMMVNQSTIKYQIIIGEDYFPRIFEFEGIKDHKAQAERVKTEFKAFEDFLTDVKNTGKTYYTYAKNFHGKNGIESRPTVEIKALENHFKGGEYIEDSEEANNIISYALGVHPLITGASPGKNGSISGTEARELFNLKRALIFPYRWQILKTLYMIKRFNKWDQNIYFAVDDIVLTTLDNDKTGLTEIENT